MKKNLTLFSFLLLLGFNSYASIPTGYYNSLEGKKGAALKTELHNIICQDTTHYLGYGSGTGKTWQGFYSTDRNPTTNQVLDMYTDSLRYFASNYVTLGYPGFGSTIEIEHSVPKSWWGCDITHPDCAARDLNHLCPADGKANNYKSNHPLGIVSGTPAFNNGCSKIGPGTNYGYVGTVFEPADQYKGDFARNYFYVATAYQHYVNKWVISNTENMMEANTYPTLKSWAVQLLMQWNSQDPVSAKEVTRNDVVYGIQQNRNPFIDHPELIDYIWGSKKYIPYRLDGNIYFPYLNWPNNNDTINLGTTYFQQPKDTVINLVGMNLTGNLTLLIGGTNATSFSVDKTTITKDEALAGYNIHLHYFGNASGDQSAILTITGGGISPISLRLKTFTSNDFSALPSTSYTSNSFVADWTPSAGATGYSLNVFSIQNTGNTTDKTVLEEDFILSMPNGWSKDGYTDGTLSSNIKLGTASQFGTITTPALDLSTATSTLTVRAKQYGSDTGAKLTATLDGQPLTIWTTGVNNQDFSVDLPVSTAISKISLTAAAGKRVYVDYVRLITHTPIYAPVSITGYPKSVGNVFSYNVTGLQKGIRYYYTVTPEGNGSATSNQVMVQLAITTAIDQQKTENYVWSLIPEGVRIKSLVPNSKISMYDSMGKCIQSVLTSTTETNISFPRKGVYLLQISNNESAQTLKVVF